MLSPDPITHDRTTFNVADPSPGEAERSVLQVVPPPPSEEAGAAFEGRAPTTDRNERLPIDPRSPLKRPASGRPGRLVRFARETLKTAATLLILVLAVLATLVIWNYYVTAPWTRDGSVRVQVAGIARLFKLQRERRFAFAPQHGQRDRMATSLTISRRRMVAMEFGTWRSGRSGGASGSVIFGKGKLREENFGNCC